MTENQQIPAPPAPAPMLESDARNNAMLINLISVAGAFLSAGVLSLIGVLVMWLLFRERSALVDFHGKQQVNLAITMTGATVIAVVGSIITLGIGAFVLFPLLLIYILWAIIGSIIAAVKANNGEYYVIALVVPVIK